MWHGLIAFPQPCSPACTCATRDLVGPANLLVGSRELCTGQAHDLRASVCTRSTSVVNVISATSRPHTSHFTQPHKEAAHPGRCATHHDVLRRVPRAGLTWPGATPSLTVHRRRHGHAGHTVHCFSKGPGLSSIWRVTWVRRTMTLPCTRTWTRQR